MAHCRGPAGSATGLRSLCGKGSLPMKKIHYAWWILVACCMIITGGMGVYRYTCGLYFTPVAKEFGVGMGAMGSLMTMQGIAGLAAVPLVSKLLPTKHIGKVVAGATLLHCLAVASLSLSQSVAHWMAVSLIVGFLGGFIYIMPTTLLLNNWFRKKLGFVLGFAMLFTGLGGAAATQLISALIAGLGWRTTCLINAALTGALIIPVSLFILKLDPKEKGLLPYGATEEDMAQEEEKRRIAAEERAARNAGKEQFFEDRETRNMFILLMVTLVLMGFGAAYTPYFPNYALSVGYSDAQGATIATCVMLGTVVWKLVLGWLNDKIGIPKAVYCGLLVAGTSLLLLLGGRSYALILFAALLFGSQQALGSLAPSLIAKKVFGLRLFTKYMACISAVTTVVASFGSGIIGAVFDANQSYGPTFLLGIGVLVVCTAGLYLTMAYKKRTNYERP